MLDNLRHKLNSWLGRHPAQASASTALTVSQPTISARSSGRPYEGASRGRRMQAWVTTRNGPTTDLALDAETLISRSRDEIRNNAYAASACDNFEAQVIGNGIKPNWELEDKELAVEIEKSFNVWARSTRCDCDGLLNFYGLQALAGREVFSAGEVFARFYIRPPSWKMKIPLQIQLIEAEQLPIWNNKPPDGDRGPIRAGIEFDTKRRRKAYHFYREHPGETMYYQSSALDYVRVPAEDVLHCYKPERAGQLRGQPRLAAVITLLHDLDEYTDAAIVKKKIQTMFTGFITKTSPDVDILPVDTSGNPQETPALAPALDPGVGKSLLEPGTMQELLPGEDVSFPTLPQDNDIETFLRTMLHKLAAGIGMTFYQLTGDLSQANYSSIRAGLLDFRRKCEQLQNNIFVCQFCKPIINRWMKEAVLAGALVLPGYFEDPEIYESALVLSLPRWAWVDPLKDVQAAKEEVRAGFTSRRRVVSEAGDDTETIDSEQAEDNARADEKGLVYESDGRVAPGKGDPKIQQELEKVKAEEAAQESSSSAPSPKRKVARLG